MYRFGVCREMRGRVPQIAALNWLSSLSLSRCVLSINSFLVPSSIDFQSWRGKIYGFVLLLNTNAYSGWLGFCLLFLFFPFFFWLILSQYSLISYVFIYFGVVFPFVKTCCHFPFGLFFFSFTADELMYCSEDIPDVCHFWKLSVGWKIFLWQI